MRADATASRAAIIDAAWQGFATNGPDISLRSIAQDAEVGIATLYRHFPTREDLFIGVVTGSKFSANRHFPRWNPSWSALKTLGGFARRSPQHGSKWELAS
ncbi:MAG: TetR/AcrR family transcriptional regulator [Corynebacterium kroppenstedtii]|nr:TetR/AcrR family transcriptional regulator [Corynebacterium kroppenstedtii]